MDVVVAARVCCFGARRAGRRHARDTRHGRRGAASRRDVPPARPPPSQGRPRGGTGLPARRAGVCVRTSRRSRRSTATSLPALHHRLVGRADALERCRGPSRRRHHPLVTITGPGGAGKSRLALEVAAPSCGRSTGAPRRSRACHRRRSSSQVRSPGRSAPASRATHSVLESVADTPERHRGAPLSRQPRAPSCRRHPRRRVDRPRTGLAGAPRRAAHRSACRPSMSSRSSRCQIEDATTLFVELAAARGVLLQEDALASVPRDLPETGRPAARHRTRVQHDSRFSRRPRSCWRSCEGLALEMEGPLTSPSASGPSEW